MGLRQILSWGWGVSGPTSRHTRLALDEERTYDMVWRGFSHNLPRDQNESSSPTTPPPPPPESWKKERGRTEHIYRSPPDQCPRPLNMEF